MMKPIVARLLPLVVACPSLFPFATPSTTTTTATTTSSTTTTSQEKLATTATSTAVEMECSANTNDKETCTGSSSVDEIIPSDFVDPCRDTHPSCATWASSGECRANPGFMRTHCPVSCDLCEPISFDSASSGHDQETAEADNDCTDLHDLCAMWAKEGECMINPVYMMSACRESCFLCVNANKMREEGFSEEDIARRKIYANTDFGMLQTYQGSDEELSTLRPIMQSMDYYASMVVSDPTNFSPTNRNGCKNHFALCAFWAAFGQCRTNLVFMLNSCPLACRDCVNNVKMNQCAGKRSPLIKAAFTEKKEKKEEEEEDEEKDDFTKSMDDMFRYIRDSGKFDQYGPEFIVMPKDHTENENEHETEKKDDPWVVRFDTFLTEEECDALIALGDDIGWAQTEPDDDAADRTPDGQAPRLNSTSARCTMVNDDDDDERCESNDIHNRVLQRVSTITGVPTSYYEPMHMVRYGYADSHGVHHDYRVHDTWKPAGPRVLSLYLCLSDVEEGGATGFPELDWLFIRPKKGQAILWPNVRSDDPTVMDERMMHELLPVVKGEEFGAHVWLHLYDWRDAYARDCV